MFRVCVQWLGTMLLVLMATTRPALAQGFDVTFFLGSAFPVYDERLTLRPGAPSLPGVDVDVVGTPELKADGGLVFGGAVAFELGIFGIEGRVDATDVDMDVTGARYDLRATVPPFQGLTSSVTLGDGQLDGDRLYLLSLNGRLRTPGPVGFVASGGLSYLPEIAFSGTIPISAQLVGIPVLPTTDVPLNLLAAPGESEHAWGVNGGAGLRIGSQHVALMAEVRVFYFRRFELRFSADDAPQPLDILFDSIDPIRFNPIIVNAQAGLVVKF